MRYIEKVKKRSKKLFIKLFKKYEISDINVHNHYFNDFSDSDFITYINNLIALSLIYRY